MAEAGIPSLQSPLVNIAAGAVPTQAWYRFFLRLFFQVSPGVIAIYGGSAPPSGTLLCDGSDVSRTTYSGLFNVIGITFGPGDGSTTFTLPNIPDVVAGAFYVIYY